MQSMALTESMTKAPLRMSMNSSHQVPNGDFASITAAADLIRAIDSAFADISSCAITATREADDARKNARVASEIARLFSAKSDRAMVGDAMPSLMERIPVFTEVKGVDEHRTSKVLSPPPPPPSSTGNGSRMHAFGIFNAPEDKGAATPLRESLGEIPIPNSNARRNRNVTASERLAKAHSDDILSLSLELDKAKRALEAEQMSHDETKSALIQAKEKHSQVDSQIEKLLNDMETLRENDAIRVDQLEEELERSRFRVAAAEEDAQLALDLAKENAESREQLEMCLRKALDEIQVLRVHIFRSESRETVDATLPEILNNGIDRMIDNSFILSKGEFCEDPVGSVSSNARPSSAMVAAGRTLVHRLKGEEDQCDATATVDESIEATAQISRRLRNRLKVFGIEDEAFPATSADENARNASSSRLASRRDLGSAVEALDVCRNTTEILKKSGKKLNLTGRWFTGQTDTQFDEIHLETLARHFCTAVEVELDRKRKEIQELESLCSVWEDGISGAVESS